jgi:TRAP-type C4-dicarboxylate transport system permease large subunit
MDNGTLITLISIGVTGLFLLGVPIFLVIGFWVVACSLVIDFTLANVGVTLFEGLSFFGVLALPLFILTGDLINAAGIAKRMSDFAYSILGWVRGGLGMATIGACGMFAAISGSNAGTTATIGSIMQPEMENNKYDKRFAAATVAAGGFVLLACMFLVLMAGTVLESLPNTIILAPILAPIAYSVGVDPIHFAVVFLVGDAIGFITPPYGLNLYVASGMTGIPYFTIVRHVLPYLFALMVAWLIIAFWSPLSTFLLQFG